MTKEEKRKLATAKYYAKNKEKYKQLYQSNKEQIKERNTTNKEQRNQYNKEYYLKNIEKERTRTKASYDKEKAKAYRIANKERLNLLDRERMLNDSSYKLKRNIRTLIRQSFKHNGTKKNTKTINILGCSIDEFKAYIETQFEPWMNWANKGLYNGQPNYGWDIDHIIPNSTATNDEDIYKLNHYTNLQPLCSYINRVVKGNKLSY